MSTSHQEGAISKGAFSQVAFALLPYLPLYREPMYYVLPLLYMRSLLTQTQVEKIFVYTA
jgi:hypothetical protein